MAWLKKTLVCPFCNTVFKSKKDKNSRIVCTNCGKSIQINHNKSKSPFSLKEIIRNVSPRFGPRKQAPADNFAQTHQLHIEIPKIKPNNRHRKVKSLRNEMSKAVNNGINLNRPHRNNNHVRSASARPASKKRRKSSKPIKVTDDQQQQIKRKKPSRKRKRKQQKKKMVYDLNDLFDEYMQNEYKQNSDESNSNQFNALPISNRNVFFYDFMDSKYGIFHEENAMDALLPIINKSWQRTANIAMQWNEKYELLQQINDALNSVNKHDFMDFMNENNASYKACVYLYRWFDDEIKCRELILRILIPFCRRYRMRRVHSNQFAECLIQKHSNSFLSIMALISIYYASDSKLSEWKKWILPKMRQECHGMYQFLAGVCIIAANDKDTEKQMKALNDLKIFCSDGIILDILRGTFMQQFMGNEENEILIKSMSEFLFGTNFVFKKHLIKMSGLKSVYVQVMNRINEIERSQFAKLLMDGNNAFDFDKSEISKRSKIKTRKKKRRKKQKKCKFCQKYHHLHTNLCKECEIVQNELQDLKDIVHELRNENIASNAQLIQLRVDVASNKRKSEMLRETINDFEIEQFTLNAEIRKIEKRRKRLSMMKRNRLDFLNWDKWNVDEVLLWIMSLDNGKYIQYKQELFDKLPLENVRGNELCLVNDDDLIHFGIKSKEHRLELIAHIKKLTNNELENNFRAQEFSPPPMAFKEFVKVMSIKQRSFDEPLMSQHSIEGILNHIHNQQY